MVRQTHSMNRQGEEAIESLLERDRISGSWLGLNSRGPYFLSHFIYLHLKQEMAQPREWLATGQGRWARPSRHVGHDILGYIFVPGLHRKVRFDPSAPPKAWAEELSSKGVGIIDYFPRNYITSSNIWKLFFIKNDTFCK